MFRCRVIANNFFAGYGNVPAGVIIELNFNDASSAILAGRVELAGS